MNAWIRTLRGVLAGILLLALPGLPAHAGEKLRVATEGAYPPFNYVDARGELGGFDVDIAKALCRAISAECDFVAAPWDGIIDGLEAGKYDVIAASMAYTEERARRVEFTDRYYRTTSSFVARRGSTLDTSVEGMRGKTVATQRSTVHADYLAATYGSSVTLKITDTQEGAFDLLVAGQADAVLCNSLTVLGFLRSDKGRDFAYIGEPLTGKNLSSSAHIALRKGNVRLRDAFNKALQEIRISGEYDQINQKYFPFSIY
ncbi:MAG: transporter substrate-binding domain-containing protein [Thermodesulfobacteriota bacterium]